jgi:hypothetical protein
MGNGRADTEVMAFITSVAAALAGVSGRGVGAHHRDAVVEAANLMAGVMMADQRASDDELWAYIESVGSLLDPPLTVTPAEIRSSRLMDRKTEWLTRPSALFELLVAADARNRGRASITYYESALALAHLTASLDLVPSSEEIAAIDRFRSVLLATFDGAGLTRPGARAPITGATPGAGNNGDAPAARAAEAAAVVPATEAEPVPAEPLETLLAELDTLVGLTSVKTEVRRLTSLLQVQQLRAERGLPVFETSHHLVFTGNPGTGKTTVARLLSRIYRSLGLVTKGHLVETDRSSLVAGYVGQTATKTKTVLESALGGTLIIDEAYALARGGENDFGREAIDTLVKFMEDHRDDLAIVVAGYPTEMGELIATNPGLASRFTKTLQFDDYSTEELVEIFEKLGEKQHYFASDGAVAVARALIASEPRTAGFGNARFVRNLFEASVAHQAMRLAPLHDVSDEQLTTLTAADIAGTSAAEVRPQ